MAGVAMALNPATVHAQDAADASAGLEEVVVTARKREETLIEVPVSVAVLTAKDIEAKGIQNLYDVAMFTPGLTYFDAIQNQLGTPVIRGISQTNLNSPDRNVAVFYGGVYLANQNTSNLELLDVERIEVVKGPQSALYGRNAFNGAINYVPATPTDALFTRFSATVGDNARYEARATVSGPITDTLRGRIAISYNTFDGSWDNRAEPSAGLGGFETKNLSAVLDWKPTDAFEARLFGYRTEDLRDSAPAYMVGTLNCGAAGMAPNVFCGEIPAATSLAANADSLAFQRHVSLGSLDLSFDFGPVQLKSQTAVFNANTDNFSDQALGEANGAGYVFNIVNRAAPAVVLRQQRVPVFVGSGKGDTRAQSQELRLEGQAGDRFNWSVGGFLFRNEFTSLGRLVFDGRGLAPTERPQADLFFLAVNPAGVAYTDPANNMAVLSRFVAEDKQKAIFGSVEFKPADRWTVGAELRRDEENRERVNTVVGPSTAQAGEYAYTTWRAHADFALTPSQQFYVSAAKGVISGYFNPVTDAVAGNALVPVELQAYDPAENLTYELGWKAEWLDRRLTTEFAAFFIDYTDIQLPSVPPAPLLTNLIQNIGGATAKGIELSVNFAATDKFQIGGTFSYTPTEFDDGTVDGGRVTECGGTAAAGIPVAARGFCPFLIVGGRALPDVSGNPLPRSPNRLASLYGAFETPLGSTDWTFFARADGSYTSETNATTLDISTIPERTIYNARLGLRKGPLDIALWSRNVTDEKYVAAVIFQPPNAPTNLGFLPNGTMGERRTIGLTATYSFGP